jgi:hypothetical protein
VSTKKVTSKPIKWNIKLNNSSESDISSDWPNLTLWYLLVAIGGLGGFSYLYWLRWKKQEIEIEE